jgi:flagellar motility protein MotE (MotC chaperone)
MRLIPIVLLASAALLALKVTGLVTQGGYTLHAMQPLKFPPLDFWAVEVTGSVDKAKPAAQSDAPKSETETAKPETPPPAAGTPVAPEKPMPAAERAILERLNERRQELEQRARELEMRETLLREAEQRLEARNNELKETEARIAAETEKKQDDKVRLKNLVTMYENMKAKEAAKILERLDLALAMEVVGQINPRRMSDIMAQMSPEAAEQLTIALASRNPNIGNTNPGNTMPAPASQLPKIEGRPGG